MSVQDVADDSKKPKAILGVRHFQALMLCLGMVLIFCIRVCMSMAIVAMTDHSKNGTYAWDTQIKGIILSSFNWGYVVLQIPGGELATRFGGMALMSSCMGVNAVVALLLPICAYYGGWQLVCACRFVQGLTQGFLNPSIHNLISKWIPVEERSSMGTMIYAGSHLGTALQLITAGFISDALGWQAIFYVNGGLGALWTLIYVFLGSNSPKSSKIISPEEQMYIEKSLGQVGEKKKFKTPWKALFTSLPFIALIVAHSGSGFGYWTLLNEIPTFQDKVLGVSLKQNGMMSALPYLVAYLCSFAYGFLSDLAIRRKWFSISTCRKISNSLGSLGPVLALLILSFAPPSVPLTITVLTVAFGFKAGTFTGYNLVHLDMAPNFAGTMIGISGSICNVVALTAPLVAGALINDDTQPSEWRKIFLLAAGIYVVSNIFFVIFATSVRQAWNEPDEQRDNCRDEDGERQEETEGFINSNRNT